MGKLLMDDTVIKEIARGVLLFSFCEIVVVKLSHCMTPGVKGQAFLLYYFFLWFVVLAAGRLIEAEILAPSMLYCSAGLARILEGIEYGMSNFFYLVLMMVGGTIIYIVLGTDTFGSGGGYGGGCGSSGSSGCGSSGCGGGGGCGGCGGD
ncbi:MAG: hypothetical protein Q3M24_01400 [Candidatus Electrothrix aestuarii]|uniref:Uncharacterized protein n=1 Tax=Candidatus Electrothrix aestuarii TaxID=3062594 RepID=A0AAU8LVY3_9BACT|nr:hypothetical protein [Candidatus Electrothrix aestuarii]